jgi:hypothetical protein
MKEAQCTQLDGAHLLHLDLQFINSFDFEFPLG